MGFLIDPVTFIAQWLRDLLSGLGLPPDLVQVVLFILGAAILVFGALFVVIFLLLAERKLLGRIQDRLGPNRVGPWGIFQTFADMLKIFTKEFITPEGADWIPYNLAPVLAMAAVLMLWLIIPFTRTTFGVNINVGVLLMMAIGAIGMLGIILGGWGSNNKFALLGAFRAVAQLISYEVPMGLILLVPVMLAGSMGLNDIVRSQNIWNIVTVPLAALIFFISAIAEEGRSPFDLLEADSELVSGFNTEFSGLKFGFFYVADFLHAFTTALLFSTIFLGGWQGPWADQVPILGLFYLGVKTVIIWFLGILIRGSMPRLRIDQMLNFNWKYLVPLSLTTVMLTAITAKIIPQEFVLIRGIALLVVNVILFFVADWITRWLVSHSSRQVAVFQRRPLARPSGSPNLVDTGGRK